MRPTADAAARSGSAELSPHVRRLGVDPRPDGRYVFTWRFDLRPLGGSEWNESASLGKEAAVDPETLETEQALDEAFENIVLMDQDSTSLDDDWMPGEFDIA